MKQRHRKKKKKQNNKNDDSRQRHNSRNEEAARARIQAADAKISRTGLLAHQKTGRDTRRCTRCAQEAFVRIFKSMDSYRGNTSFAAWIYRIATNEALRLISRRHDSVSMEREGTNILDQMPADNYINIADTEAVNMQRAILALPPKQQVVFNMRFYDEMEYGDIAAATDSSVAAVKMNYHLAKEKVKKAIIN